MTHLLQRRTSLPAHVVQFAQYLREKEFEIGPSEELDYLTYFSKQLPRSFESQHALFKAVFVKNRKDFQRFDELYKTYWTQLARAEDSKTKEEPNRTKKTKQKAPSLNALKSWLHGGRITETEDVAAYSAFEALAQKDFSHFAENEHQELRSLIRLLARRLANKHNRRFVNSKQKEQIDLKNSIRLALRQQGELTDFRYHQPKKKKVNLIVLCDVSKSMELYSKFLITFLYNFQYINQTLKTFAFSTQLSPLTRLLRDGNFEQVLDNLGETVPHWSGGTRIGASLQQFRTRYGHTLNSQTIIVILSDGWDTGEPEILDETMAFLKKKSNKILWLNPLAGNPDFEPTVLGMKTCLPYIDQLLPFYNLESLKDFIYTIRP